MVCVLVLSGCRSDPNVALLERDLRYLEDKVYSLQDVVEEKDSQINSIRRENETLRKRLGLPDLNDDFQSRSDLPDTPELLMATGLRPVTRSPALQAPTIDLGMALDADEAEVIDRHVTAIQINPRLSGGYDFDKKPGDEGVMVVIEPRNRNGQYVDETGQLSVVVLDPAREGKDAYVARWDFDSIDAQAKMKRSLLGKGIHLQLPWTAGYPEHETLVLFVRYETPDGRKLEQKKEIRVQLPATISSRWTPAMQDLQPRMTHAPRINVPSVVDLTPPADSPEAATPAARTATAPEWKPYR
ncbi:hypothetical protein DSM3645_01280 [Blastopirellula marina DSM 3645]|uniref:Uncharacterized protein n=1 Tax=Blastopirellula marina DSM 3645 TaxID=314230 RepID=A3ZMX5_9BACT|nr:hypothetical protein DSM3645_01280 [Blastopirellula marina DSM 3645]